MISVRSRYAPSADRSHGHDAAPGAEDRAGLENGCEVFAPSGGSGAVRVLGPNWRVPVGYAPAGARAENGIGRRPGARSGPMAATLASVLGGCGRAIGMARGLGATKARRTHTRQFPETVEARA